MPNIKSASEAAVRKNTKIEIAAGKKPKQAFAIAKNIQRKQKSKRTTNKKITKSKIIKRNKRN